MSEKQPKIYKRRRPGRLIAGIIAAVLIAAVLLSACIFFGFRKYAVHDETGTHLEIPWLQNITN